MRERLINRRQQGDLGEASAIEWLTWQGATVWIPVGHSPDCDLVAEVDCRLLRIQVKTSTFMDPTPDGHERWSVLVCTHGGNQSWSGMTKRFDATRADFLYVLTGHGRRWLIPTDVLEASQSVSLGGTKYSEFEIDCGSPIMKLVYENPANDPRIRQPGEYPSGQRMATVNRPAYAFAGSNPASPTHPRPTSERKLGRAGQAIVRGKRLMTIPARPYAEAGLEVGDRMRFHADGRGRVIMERIEPPAAIFDPAVSTAEP